MSEPFLAEIRMVGFNFAPRGWAFCNGQILPIKQNQSLFSLLGTIYGGDGRTSFALPELRGRTPIHVSGDSHKLGQKGGEETHTLSVSEMPSHNHIFQVSSKYGELNDMVGKVYAVSNNEAHIPYSSDSTGNMNFRVIGSIGGNQPHENMQPFLTINFCIALQGTFPPL